MAILINFTNCIWQNMTENLTMSMAFAVLILTITYLLIQYKKIQKLPPGPWGRPFIGMIGRIKKEFHLFLFDYVKQFGKLFSISMGNSTLVILSDHKLIKKAFQSKDFSARPKGELTKLFGGYGKSKKYIIPHLFS